MKVGDFVVYHPILSRSYLKTIYTVIEVKDFIVYIEHPESHCTFEEAKCNLQIATEEEIADWVTEKLTGNSVKRRYESN